MASIVAALQVEEASLTGESLPVEKNVGLKVHEVNVHVQGLRVSNVD